jgi:carbonic anhydrase/acetyltransferase-like protein (isoleucine patch superfamily)
MLTYASGKWIDELPQGCGATVYCHFDERELVKARGCHAAGTSLPAEQFRQVLLALANSHGEGAWPTSAFKTFGSFSSPSLGSVRIWPSANVSPLAAIDPGIYGENTEIYPHAHVDNLVHVGHSVRIHQNATIVAGSVLGGWAEIGEGAKIVSAKIRDSCKVGEDALVGWGAVVVKDVPPGAIVYGNPARIHGWRDGYGPAE